jgi:nucleoside-diphosphate-sugar epimerase
MDRGGNQVKVFVAGATGVLGWRAVRELVDTGHDVTGIARSEEKAELLQSLGATPVQVDLFDATAVRDAVAGHDAVLNLATHVPKPTQAVRRSAWLEHERIRSEGARILVDAALAAGASVYVQESLAFAYADAGDRAIDEDHPLMDGGAATAVKAAEAEAARFTAAGGRGIALRFGQFYSPDSSHTEASLALARRGMSMIVGAPDGYQPIISCEDAARAVVAALDAPAGVYNVVDDEPMTRREQDAAMAAAVHGRRLLRAPASTLKVGGEDAGIFLLSNRSSNARFKAATGWSPRLRSAREGFRNLVRDLPGERMPLWQTLALTYLGLGALIPGIYATLAPRAFFDDFPMGRGWVASEPPYSEHMMRDFGGLNLALACVLLVAAFVGTRVLVRTAAFASLLFAVPHLIFHLRHRVLEGADAVLSPATLALGVLLAVAVLATTPARPQPQARSRIGRRPVPARS